MPLGPRTILPVVVIVPDGIAPPLQSPELGAYDCIARTPSLSRDLPLVLTRAIDRARRLQMSPQAPSMTQPARPLETTPRDAGREAASTAFDAAVRSGVPPATSASQTIRNLATLRERRQREEQLETLLDLERSVRVDLEQKLAHLTAALKDAERQHLSAMAVAAKPLHHDSVPIRNRHSASRGHLGHGRRAVARSGKRNRPRTSAVRVVGRRRRIGCHVANRGAVVAARCGDRHALRPCAAAR